MTKTKKYCATKIVAHSANKSLLAAMRSELIELGYEDQPEWNERHLDCNFLNINERGQIEYHRHNCGSKVFELPKQWDEFMKAAMKKPTRTKKATPVKKVEIAVKEGDIIKVKYAAGNGINWGREGVEFAEIMSLTTPSTGLMESSPNAWRVVKVLTGRTADRCFLIQKEAFVEMSSYEEYLRATVKEGDYLTVLDTKQVRGWRRGKEAIGYVFCLATEEACDAKDLATRIKELKNGCVFVPPGNELGINFFASDLRFSTKEEIEAYKKKIKAAEYKVGDWVTVVNKNAGSLNIVGDTYIIREITTGGLCGKTQTIYNLNKDPHGSYWECADTIRPATKEEIAAVHQPLIRINEYDLKIDPTGKTASFGCQTFTLEELKAINRLFNLPQGASAGTIKLGDTNLTKSMMERILRALEA